MEDYEEKLAEALKKLAKEKGPEFAMIIEHIIRGQRKRWEQYLAIGRGDTQDYVMLVAQTYQKLHTYLDQLQEQKDDAAWVDLTQKLRTWTYNYLLNKGFFPGKETAELAAEYAADAVPVLLSAPFHYDTTFEQWAVRIVQNICRVHIKRATPAVQTIATDFNEYNKTLNHVLYLLGSEHRRNEEMQQDLRELIEELTDVEREVVELRYIEGYKYPEIAERLGLARSTIYQIHFRAISTMRKKVGKKTYNIVRESKDDP